MVKFYSLYSYFCLCEYAIVSANMYFHYTAKHDFAHISIVLPSRVIPSKVPTGYSVLPVHNNWDYKFISSGKLYSSVMKVMEFYVESVEIQYTFVI